MKNLKNLFVIGLMLVSQLASSQCTSLFDKYKPAKRWAVGVQVGPTHTMSDADNFIPGLAFGGHVKYSVSQTFGLKLMGNIGTLNGNREDGDISGNGRNGLNGKNPTNRRGDNNTFNAGNAAPSYDSYFFKNNFKDLSISAVFTLGNISFLRPLRKTQLYFFTGVGVIWSDAQGEFTSPRDAEDYYNAWGNDFFTPEYDNNGNFKNAISSYQGQNFTIPFGIGAKRNLNRWLDLGIEYRNSYTRSDNLDAYSFPVWRNRVFDFYGILGLQASIKLGGGKSTEDHYDWLNPVEDIYAFMDTMCTISNDTDKDGVADRFDKEADTEEGAYVWGNGVTADTDGDGVPDHRDEQSIYEKGAEVDENGVMIDIDGDMVPDFRDQEVSEPGANVNPLTGVTIKAAENNSSCCNCENVILPSIIFENGSSNIPPYFYGVLFNIAEKMKECPNVKITTCGYDMKSKSSSQLSAKRIRVIVDYLNANYNIPRDRFVSDPNCKAPSGMEYTSRRIDLKKAK